MITLLDGIAERGSPMYYNFVRIHKTLRCSPAMAAGVTDRLWELEDIAALIDAAASKPGRRGPYKKKEG